MKKSIILCTLLLGLSISIQAEWKPVGNKIKTIWAEKVDPTNVLPEYPRPQMERTKWMNLNGLWQYTITPKGIDKPKQYDGEILVPFPIESSLSGVQKEVGKDHELWYKRSLDIPSNWKGSSIILHFGAVDWQTEVYINDILIGSHQGGFTPFSFDITPFLTGTKNQNLSVRVWDPTDEGYQATGKQRNNPKGIWYTPVTGIWQTVWIEPVEAQHITAIKAIPNIDINTLYVTVSTSDRNSQDIITVELMDKGSIIATAKGVQDKEMRLTIPQPNLWSPENPFLYKMKVKLTSGKKVLDKVNSYTAFRKISYKRDAMGFMRMQLNNKDYFQFGPLDQGWWPDGLYTAPTDEALLFDITKTKEWGFNMIRKHMKVEPARWYYHCDREGMLVWQDMPSSELGNHWNPKKYNGGTDQKRTKESIANFYQEWKEIIDLCISHPCIVVWTPFNEAWGQFDTKKVVEWTKAYDPSRLINPASGGNHRDCGDLLDLHNYPEPRMYLQDNNRVNVLGEYGGIGMIEKEHLWEMNTENWGYVKFTNKEAVTNEYVKFTKILKELVRMGFSAAVYTQTTDVENEINGLMTYDRKKIKIIEKDVRSANLEVINTLPMQKN